MKQLPSRRLLALLTLLLLLAVSAPGVYADTTYVVQPGDTLSSIARAHGTTVQAIAAANNLMNPNLILAGQILVIPGPGAGPATTPAPVGTATPTAVTGGQTTTYTVQPGDSLYRIAAQFGVTVASIVQANNISNPGFIYVGQRLILPGARATGGVTPQATPQPAATPVAAPTQPPAPVTGANLLPNPSFEQGRYNHNNIEELQVPNGWFLYVDEGPNNLQPGSGGNFFRPESRVLPSSNLPSHERAQFIWDGDYTIKIFKGGAPTSFALFTDVHLQPGAYRMTINFFPDMVMSVNADGSKVWANDPLSGEVRIIVNDGGSGWTTTQIGERNSLTHTFTVTSARTVRVGAAFRNRFVLSNNGWFLDQWSLQRVSN
jgi:LysM repeat protein